MAPGVAPSAVNALPDLATAINNAIAPIYHARIALVSYPSQGDFPWWYQNTNGVFNQRTFDYVSARVSSSGVAATVRLSPSGGFPNAYVQVVNDLIYTLGSGDLQTLSRTLGAASAEASTMVSDYQTTFGPITSAQMTVAGVATKQDYVVSYVMGSLWSGKAAVNQPPLTYSNMAAAASLLTVLPNTPAAGLQVVADASAYLRIMAPANALLSQVQLGEWIAGQLRANTSAPSDSNGGMQTVDPDTGIIAPGFLGGYGIRRAIGDIQADLNDTTRVLSVVVSAPAAFSGGSGDRSAAAPSTLRFVRADGLACDVLPPGVGSAAQSITIDYQGYTMVPVAPTAWQSTTNCGWFYADPIAEAQANGSRDVTGFKFATTPAYNLGDLASGGNLGQLSSLLISNYPTVTATVPRTSVAALATTAFEGTSGALSLFGVRLGDPNRVTYQPAYAERSAAEGVAVIFAPSTLQVSNMLQTAYVIGATIDVPSNVTGR